MLLIKIFQEIDWLRGLMKIRPVEIRTTLTAWHGRELKWRKKGNKHNRKEKQIPNECKREMHRITLLLLMAFRFRCGPLSLMAHLRKTYAVVGNIYRTTFDIRTSCILEGSCHCMFCMCFCRHFFVCVFFLPGRGLLRSRPPSCDGAHAQRTCLPSASILYTMGCILTNTQNVCVSIYDACWGFMDKKKKCSTKYGLLYFFVVIVFGSISQKTVLLVVHCIQYSLGVVVLLC